MEEMNKKRFWLHTEDDENTTTNTEQQQSHPPKQSMLRLSLIGFEQN